VCAQVFQSYGNASVTAALPIPASLQPSSVATAPNISYPDSAASDLYSFTGNVTKYFGLRFTGELFSSARPRHAQGPDLSCGQGEVDHIEGQRQRLPAIPVLVREADPRNDCNMMGARTDPGSLVLWQLAVMPAFHCVCGGLMRSARWQPWQSSTCRAPRNTSSMGIRQETNAVRITCTADVDVLVQATSLARLP